MMGFGVQASGSRLQAGRSEKHKSVSLISTLSASRSLAMKLQASGVGLQASGFGLRASGASKSTKAFSLIALPGLLRVLL